MKLAVIHHIIVYVVLALCTVTSFSSVSAASDRSRIGVTAVDSLFMRGEKAIDSGDEEEAMEIFSLICSLDDGTGQRRVFSMAHQRRGYILYCRESYAEAMQEYLKARGIAERSGLRDRLSSIYTNIGNVFASNNDLETGISFYRKALVTEMVSSEPETLPILYNNLLYAYYLKENPDSVRKYFRLFKSVNPSDTRSRYDLILNEGLLDDMEGRSDKAVSLFHKAAAFSRENRLSGECEAAANSYIARTYERKEMMDSALHYLKLNERMARENNFNTLLVESLRDMARIYDKLGYRMDALQCKSEYLSISDSLFSRETLYLIKNSQALYEKNSDAYTISNLNDANVLQRYWIIALFVVLAVIALLSIGLWRQKRKLSHAYGDLYERNVVLLESERRYTEKIEALENSMAAAIEPLAEPTEQSAQRKSLIPQKQREELLTRICKVIEQPEFYCDPDCSIDRLAAAIDSNARYVSEVINKEYGVNFRSFINRYRIKEAMRRLVDTEHYGHLTIKAIAESVGYKSQATFISVFTKETGLKPSLYQQLARRRQTGSAL